MARLVRFDPFRELEALRREMERVFDTFLAERGLEGEFVWTPPLEVKETDDRYIVRMDIPGVNKKDIKIEVTDNTLIVSGERKEEKEEKEASYYRREIAYGSFYRAIQLPSDIDPEKINAKYENGVLVIEIPKSEKARKREIKVQ